MNISETLKERGKTHGAFKDHAQVTQDLLYTMMNSPNWEMLRATQKECLHMVAHKIGRILVGDPNVHDHWWDQIGYLQLIVNETQDPRSTSAVRTIEIMEQNRPGTPEDGGQHARQERYDDGLREPPPWPSIMVTCDGEDYYLTNRRVLPAEDWEHLPRLPVDLTHKEWTDTLPEYRPLYIWDEGKEKYLMLAQRRDHWGKEP